MVLIPQGGGQALPPYLQARTPSPAGPYQTAPAIQPKSTAVPGEVKSPLGGLLSRMKGGLKPKGFLSGAIQPKVPGINPTGTSPTTGAQPMSGGIVTENAPAPPATNPAKPTDQTGRLKSIYDFFKKDLENNRNQELSSAKYDAEARGVYYGTPLTTSEGDINTSYLRGLGQLQAGMYGNEQQSQLERLRMATQLMGSNPQAGAGGIDPSVYQMLGPIFGGGGATPPSAIAAPRPGPASGLNLGPMGKLLKPQPQ